MRHTRLYRRALTLSLRLQDRSYITPLFAIYTTAVVTWIVVLLV